MSIDGDDAVERLVEEPADDTLADRFARPEGRILAHVRKIRRNEHQPFRALAPQRFRGEQQDEQLLVRLVERRIDDRRRRRGTRRNAQLSVGKPMNVDFVARNGEQCREPTRIARRRRQVLKADAAHRLARVGGGSPSMT